jgi:hypothetical protein
MAPEQVRGQADRRSDIFSVAAVSYELLSGRPPFAGDDPLQILEQLRTTTPARLTELDPSLPAALADVIERALQKDPADRVADLGQMGQQIEMLRRELAAGAADDAGPRAQPAPLPAASASVAATTPTAPATDRAEPARLPRQLDHDAAHEPDRERTVRVPRIAIGTGAALVALAAVALYIWWPGVPRASRVEGPGPAVSTTSAAGPVVDPAAAPEVKSAAPEVRAAVTAEPDREPPARDAERARATSRRSLSTTSTPTTVKPDVTNAPPREGDRTQSVAAAPSGARDEAEHARQRMIAARQAAERVAAGFYARKRFGSAQGKERDGLAALGKADYAAAAGLFAAAQAEYQAAAVEAPREEENERQLARLRTGLDQAHAAAAARRQQALAAGADQLARDLFDQAQARQVEGDGLASRKDLVAAARAYQDAAARYEEATARARAARPAR